MALMLMIRPAGVAELQSRLLFTKTRTLPEKAGVKDRYTLLAVAVQVFPELLKENAIEGLAGAPSR